MVFSLECTRGRDLIILFLIHILRIIYFPGCVPLGRRPRKVRAERSGRPAGHFSTQTHRCVKGAARGGRMHWSSASRYGDWVSDGSRGQPAQVHSFVKQTTTFFSKNHSWKTKELKCYPKFTHLLRKKLLYDAKFTLVLPEGAQICLPHALVRFTEMSLC